MRNHCEDCRKLIPNYYAKRCRKCYYKSMKKSRLGENNPNYKHGKKTCADCDEELNDYRNNLCQKCYGNKISGKNGYNYKHGKYCKDNKFYCEKCGERISSGKAKRCKTCAHKGKDSYWYGKISHGKWGKYKGIYMRSSWEIKFAQFLDCSGIKWQYEPKAFDLSNTTYRPDFYIPEWKVYIEIKGYWRKDAKKKFELFKKSYPNKNIKILDKEKLIKLGIL